MEERSGMNRIWDLCKLLNNAKKLTLLLMICQAEQVGVTVKELVESMRSYGLKATAVSTYLKQLATLGLLRRMRSGMEVRYIYDTYRARAEVREVMEMIRARLVVPGGDADFTRYFRVLMNPFRAKVARRLLEGKSGKMDAICDAFGCSPVLVWAELEIGVEEGMFKYADGEYVLHLPNDAILRRIIELSK